MKVWMVQHPWRALTAVLTAMVLTLGGCLQLGRAAGSHSYRFLQTQGGRPVAFNHCKAIHYQVNPFEAPPQWEAIVHDAFDDISRTSGFVFVEDGATTKRSLIGGGYYPGNPLEPVLISWADSAQVQLLGGDTIGYGGPLGYDMGRGYLVYLTGRVVLDADFRRSYTGVSVQKAQTMVLEHELGHVLGLAHSGDPFQLMYAGYHGQRELGRGDVAGLKALHDVQCL